ncbi:MAG TPA: hypothetical protein VKX28_15645, partial [Xanthobacteraceae bacterium]|nr:hypothetical protein [Xanthobacteraceae bacterium]
MRLLLVAIVVLAAVVGVGHAELVLDISALRSQLGGYAALGAGASLSLVDYNKLVAVAFQDWGGLLNDRLRKELSRSGVGNTVDVRSRIATASALGVPSDMVIAGGSTLTGNGQPDIYYLNAGNQTVNASAGDDNFVMGAHFGQDVINAVQGGTSIANALAPATGQTDI